jgi:hypothetical protein
LTGDILMTWSLHVNDLQRFLPGDEAASMNWRSVHWMGYTWRLCLNKQGKSYECDVAIEVGLPYYMHYPKDPMFLSAAASIQCNLANMPKKRYLLVPQYLDHKDGCWKGDSFTTTLKFSSAEKLLTLLEPNKTYKISLKVDGLA